jgi:hypothetical protein
LRSQVKGDTLSVTIEQPFTEIEEVENAECGQRDRAKEMA